MGEYIHASGLNPTQVMYIDLWGGPSPWERYHLSSLYNVNLTREYLYTEFDQPPAKLTGKILDRGIDTDSDGDYNYLEISVQVNVTKPGEYTVYVLGLRGEDYNYTTINVWGENRAYLDVGTNLVNITLNGYAIRSSQINPRYVDYINLYDRYYNSLYGVNLTREYLYTEFDAAAVLTGISDWGNDTDVMASSISLR